MVPLNNRAADVESKPETDTGATLYRNALDLVETLPDTLLLFHRNTYPPIAHSHARHLTVKCQRHLYGTDLRRVFQGIRQVIRQHLTDTIGIRQHRHVFLLWQLDQNGAR